MYPFLVLYKKVVKYRSKKRRKNIPIKNAIKEENTHKITHGVRHKKMHDINTKYLASLKLHIHICKCENLLCRIFTHSQLKVSLTLFRPYSSLSRFFGFCLCSFLIFFLGFLLTFLGGLGF